MEKKIYYFLASFVQFGKKFNNKENKKFFSLWDSFYSLMGRKQQYFEIIIQTWKQQIFKILLTGAYQNFERKTCILGKFKN